MTVRDMTEPRHDAKMTGTMVAHTHWDRAWYLPFQQFRIRLVRLIDRLLDILDSDPAFRCFMLDGQMIVIEDYLEVRPERRADIERLARAGRLQIGPWYVLPDEFLVSPEALIRNLELGMRLADEFGGPMFVGYEPDAFGHIAQLPQIFAGFGIDNVVFWRGLGDEVTELGSEFWWLAPDGTRALTIFLPLTYGQFSFLGYPHRGDEANMPFRMEWAIERLESGIEDLTRFANTPCLLLMAGVDHTEANRHLPAIVREANERLTTIELQIGSIAEHIECVRPYGQHLPEYRGELRFGAAAFVLQQVYSARMHLKQRNTFCQSLLERYAEPLTALAGMLGAASQQAFLDLTWRELLKNHPHDDICGCSVDPVHREMERRFDTVQQIGAVLVRDALRFLTDRITLPDTDGVPLFVFNPNGRPYGGTFTATLALPVSGGAFESFAVRDERGTVVPHQEIGRRTEVVMEVNRPRRTHFVDVALSLPAIPACGYRTFFIGAPGEPPATDLRTSSDTIENDHLRVTVRPDGTITILDRDTGTTFAGLHALEDTEDAGDEYTYAPAPEGKTLTTADAAVEIEPLPSGRVRAGFRIRYRLSLPEGLTPDRVRRSAETVRYEISTDVWLGAGERRVDFVTRLTNTVRDHRLRVLFPTPIRTDTVAVDGHFAVIERPVMRPEGTGWAEPPSPTAHQRSFVDVSDGSTGLAIFNRGLPEYEAVPGAGGVGIALTLLRCVGWLSRGDLSTRPGHAGPELATPEAQCLREYEFHYAVAPHPGSWETILPEALAYATPCTLVTDRTTEGALPSDIEQPAAVTWEPIPRPPGLDLLPPSASFLTLEPADLVLSALRSSRDGAALVMRCYNPTNRAVTGRLRPLSPIRAAAVVNFREENPRELGIESGEVLVEVGAGQVVTIRCEIER